MRSTANLIESLTSNHTASENKVEPTKSLIFGAMPCEERAATITTETHNYMKNGDTSGVAGHYLLNKRAEDDTTVKAGFFTIIAVLFAMHAYFKNPASWVFFALALGNALPNINNMSRYEENKTDCEDWLKNKVGKPTFKEIKKLSSRKETPQLVEILKRENIDTTTLRKTLTPK